MPNRLLRDGICTSDAINALSPDEEVMFYRLLVVADDYGFMDARPAILKAMCFPLKDCATPNKIEHWLASLAKTGLIVRYEKASKPFLAINKWEQRQRSRQKYPGPSDDGCQTVGGQLSDICPTDDGLGRGKGRGKGASSERISLSAGEWDGISEVQLTSWVQAYPAVDVSRELAKAAAWVVSNPSRQKSHYARFINNWLARAQDSARPAAKPGGLIV